MILINLLPHREAARKRRRDIFNVSLAASALLGGLIAGSIFLWYQAEISVQQGANALLETEIKKLEAQIKEIANLEAEIAALRARQTAVEDLQSDRNLPVHLLTELTRQLPDGVFIKQMVQAGQVVTINGSAASNERVSELLRNIANNTPWFTRPELVEIVAGTASVSAKDSRRVSNFVMRFKLLRASEVAKAQQAAAAAPAQPGAATPAVAAAPAAAPATAAAPAKPAAAGTKP